MAAIAWAGVALALLGGAQRRLCIALGTATLLPWAAAFGSTNDLASQTTFCAGIFGLVAVVAACAVRSGGRTAVFVALALVVITGAAIVRGSGKPYRLAAPVWNQTEPVAVGARGERLTLDPRTAAFAASLRDVAGRTGFCAGDPVLDFTGELPGTAVMLGGRTPGLPWLFGGYPFSEKLAAWILAGVDAETRARAWLVVGEGRIALSVPFVASLGFELPQGYDVVLDARHPIHGTPVRLLRSKALPRGPASCPRTSQEG
jgi:hypothetical protein